MDEIGDVWERYYRTHPVDWKGSPAPLPDLRSRARVLDIGCGTGSTLIQAHEMGYIPVGIDLSDTAVSRARERFGRRGSEVHVDRMDARSGLEGLGVFDCILLHHVLDSLMEEDRGKVVKNCLPALKKGGIISFQDIAASDVRYGNGAPVEKNTFRKGDGLICHFFTEEEVSEIFGDMERLELDTLEWEQGKGKSRIKRSRVIGLFRKDRV